MTDEAPEGASTDPLVDTGRDTASRGTLAVGVDVGGSGIKAAVVDTTTGQLVSERLRVPTPTPSTPDRVSASIGRLVRRLAKADELGKDTPVGIGLPGVAIGGVLMTAANIDPAWIGYPIAERLSYLLKRRVEIVNDADAAGIA
jgi:polyphosphate glucokinase